MSTLFIPDIHHPIFNPHALSVDLVVRKSNASMQAVDERQALETLSREEKTANRTLAQLTERSQNFEEKKKTRSDELHSQLERKGEVYLNFPSSHILMATDTFWLRRSNKNLPRCRASWLTRSKSWRISRLRGLRLRTCPICLTTTFKPNLWPILLTLTLCSLKGNLKLK